MARQVVIMDDIDGSPDAEAIDFTYRGERYTIDLASKNAKKFDDIMAEYIGHAQKLGGASRPAGTASRGGGQKPKRAKEQIDAIRSWARENGWPDLSDRGRIPYAAEEAFEAAHK